MSTVSAFKVGDVIRRKDMPMLHFVITGEDSEWGGRYFLKKLYKANRGEKAEGFITKDDDRWELNKDV